MQIKIRIIANKMSSFLLVMFVANMYEVASRKEVVESNKETKDEILGRKKAYTYIFIHCNNKWNGVRTEDIRVHPIINDNVRPNLYSINVNTNA